MLHNNVQKFIGIAVNDSNFCGHFVVELCQKGSLQNLIENPRIQLDWEFKNSLIKDLSNVKRHTYRRKAKINLQHFLPFAGNALSA
jgi:hypothetical protein